MPDVGPGLYLVEAFQKLGFARSDLDGLVPQTWAEIDAFARRTERITTAWEAEALFNMSWAYVNEFTKASAPLRKSPMERADNG